MTRLWLQYPECVLTVGFHPERLHTKHWEIAAARWEQNSNKWRPANWKMKASWQYNCPTSPCLLVFRANWKQMNLGVKSCSGLWALLQAVNHLPREVEESGSINLLLLSRTRCSSRLKLLESFRHTGPLYTPTRQVFILFYGWETKAWGGQLTPDSKAPHSYKTPLPSSTLCSGKLARKIGS